MKTRHCLAALMLLVSPLALASQKVSFAAGKASVPLPDNFRVTTDGDELTAVFGSAGDHQLDLSLIKELANAKGATDLAIKFVQMQGTKKGIKVSSDEDRAVLMENGGQETLDGRTFQSVNWQIAVGNCLFIMTVTAPLPMSKELDDFLGDPLNAIANGLSCKGN